MTKNKIYTLILFAISITFFGFGQLHLKKAPQEILLVLIGIPIFLILFKNKKPFLGYFYSLFGLVLYSNYFFALLLLLNTLFPKRHMIIIDGVERQQMNTADIWVIPASLIITLLTLRTYRKRLIRLPKLELVFLSFFFCSTLVIYILTEY